MKHITIPRSITADTVSLLKAAAADGDVVLVSPLCATGAGRAKLKQALREAGVPEEVVRVAGLATAAPEERSPEVEVQISAAPAATVEIASNAEEEIPPEPKHGAGISPEDTEEIPVTPPRRSRRGRRKDSE